ncbi:hypothetical protein HMPREF0591_2958 [Mycobacterium parascrofulaceum ATCC BAA-614]|uniref:Uncharacterized protein n=1 Tax=Mycobacterium parascrofulaceum ATCC BAA-614 TaxID=525368 RepID=D5P9W4_9MYCO|nr:hypothetical protein HMPREF0591_2958 [Mycobacterium parascrofulaceum ATCC BAA-614]
MKSTPIAKGITELRAGNGRALLMEPNARIFSHLMLKSLAEIDRITTTGIE